MPTNHLSFQDIRTLIEDIYPMIFTKNEISPLVFMGQAVVESSGNPAAFKGDSNGGSYGLFQIDKKFLAEWGFNPNTDLFNPKQNAIIALTRMHQIFLGTVSGTKQLTTLSMNLRVAMMLVCYNCGAGNFELLYKNHLQNTSLDWNAAIQNESLVANWHNCLNYPVKVFSAAKNYFNLPVQSTIKNSQLETAVCLFPKNALGPYIIKNF